MVQLDYETALSYNPDLVLCVGMSETGEGHRELMEADFANNPEYWNSIPAIANGDVLYLPVRFAADVFGCKVDDIFHDARLRGVSDDGAKAGIKRDCKAGLLADLTQGGFAFGLITLHMAFRKRPMTAVYMADEQNFTSVFGLPRNDRAAGNFFFQKMTSLQFAAENRRR